jgi:2-amino-4-hydroxy-6-hydroxymethyldihydropteridine diphosphokinase
LAATLVNDISYLGLGSNLGDRRSFLESAVIELASRPGIEVLNVSSVYETGPVGVVEQPMFLNGCACVRASGTAGELLRHLFDIEALHGRERSERWGPRTLDLDLLLCGDQIIDTPDLTVPHPHMTERCFVLVPLCEMAPDLRHPVSGRPFEQYCGELDCESQVRRVGGPAALHGATR